MRDHIYQINTAADPAEMDFLVGLSHISIIIIFNSGFFIFLFIYIYIYIYIFLAYDNACESSLAYGFKKKVP